MGYRNVREVLPDDLIKKIQEYIDGESIYIPTDEGNGILEIKNIATEPDCQGKGYGKQLIEFVASDKVSVYRTKSM